MKIFIYLSGCILTSWFALTTYITFYLAYFNGGKVVVNVNEYGEADFEFVYMTISIPICIYFLITNIKWLRKEYQLKKQRCL